VEDIGPKKIPLLSPRFEEPPLNPFQLAIETKRAGCALNSRKICPERADGVSERF